MLELPHKFTSLERGHTSYIFYDPDIMHRNSY